MFYRNTLFKLFFSVFLIALLIAPAVAGAAPALQAGASSTPTAIMDKAYALNVRTGPGTGYMVITAIPRGIRLDLTGYRDGSAAWVTVRLPNGREGWVSSRYLSSTFPFQNLQILQDVQPPQGDPGVPPLAMVSGTSALNVRTGPGTGYMRVTAVPFGTRVTLTGYRDAAAEWVTVRLPSGQEGWVSGRYLSTPYSYYHLQVLHDVQPPQPPQDGQSGSRTATVNAVYALNVRSGPGIGYAVVVPVLRGTNLVLTGYRDATFTWVSVRLPDGREGWTHSGYLTTAFPLHNLQPIN